MVDLEWVGKCTLSINLLTIIARKLRAVKTRVYTLVSLPIAHAVSLWYDALRMTTLPPSGNPARAERLAFYMLKAVNKAVRDRAMIADGDSVLVAVSGGKDSLTLLDLLHRRRRMAPERYDLVAGLVRSDHHCGRCVSEEWLRAWCAARDIALVTGSMHVAAEIAAARPGGAGPCFLCARRRRKAILELAREQGCGKVALGHHADDLAETALMNLFYNARLETMALAMPLFGGLLTLIRPLAYVEERDIVTYARAAGYPIAGEPCPDGARSRRALARHLLREVEASTHGAKRRILNAARRCAQAPDTPEDVPRASTHPEEDDRVGQ